MGHKFDPRNASILDRRDRMLHQNPMKILEMGNIAPGMKVADIGCGTGFFTIPASRMVGEEGRVYAVDIGEEMLDIVKGKISALKVKNIDVLKSEENAIPIDDSVIDLALMINLLHELDGDGTLGEVKRILKDGGALLVVDWKKVEMEEGPPYEDRVSMEDAKKVIGSFFKELRVLNPGKNHYGLLARK